MRVSVVALIWLFALLVLSLFYANPVTLNRDQVLTSTDIVTVTVVNVDRGEVRIEKSWRGLEHEETLTLPTLKGCGAATGQRLLIPIRHRNQTWRITPTPLSELGAIYPATEEAAIQLRSLLDKGHLPTQPKEKAQRVEKRVEPVVQ